MWYPCSSGWIDPRALLVAKYNSDFADWTYHWQTSTLTTLLRIYHKLDQVYRPVLWPICLGSSIQTHWLMYAKTRTQKSVFSSFNLLFFRSNSDERILDHLKFGKEDRPAWTWSLWTTLDSILKIIYQRKSLTAFQNVILLLRFLHPYYGSVFQHNPWDMYKQPRTCKIYTHSFIFID